MKTRIDGEPLYGGHGGDSETVHAKPKVISVNNRPLNNKASDEDFTEESYRRLLRLAKEKYEFTSYSSIPWGNRFVLWRHDCDYSINRAHAIARIEVSEGVRSTFFLNPHCAYYNLFEKSQYMLVHEIVEMGHEIGLHFDASFYGASNEAQLFDRLRAEADVLQNLFGVRPESFSFHNPAASDLEQDAETYCGMVNCYSSRFKTEVSYCSDSNGYWRFRRLEDVLQQASEPSLQILTHPEWWQKTAMPPRKRIFRSVHGRSVATMRLSDDQLQDLGRQNISGPAGALSIFRDLDPDRFEFYDFLWNRGKFSTLYWEIWRLHERQVEGLCSALLQTRFAFSDDEAKMFLAKWSDIPVAKRFRWIAGRSLAEAGGVSAASYRSWVAFYKRSLKDRDLPSAQTMEEGCIFTCGVIDALVRWAAKQSLISNGSGDPHPLEEELGTGEKQFETLGSFSPENLSGQRSAISREVFMDDILKFRSRK